MSAYPKSRRLLQAMGETERRERVDIQETIHTPGQSSRKGLPGGDTGGQEALPEAAAIAAMSLDAFRASGLVVVVRSSILGEELVFAADGTMNPNQAKDEEGRVIYRGKELRLVAALVDKPGDLRAFHALKKAAGSLTVESMNLPAQSIHLESIA